MCGIVGYIGKKDALPVLLEGLRALEYRGYDSAGVALLDGGTVRMKRSVGNVAQLETSLVADRNCHGRLGIGHTRWATHGIPSEANAHPHRDCGGRVFVVHNGIIENYRELKTYLEKQGHIFRSDTDTEVLAHLIENFIRSERDFESAFFDALHMIRGAYAVVVLDKEDPDTLYAAKLSSPLVIGVGDGEQFIASDATALVGKTKQVVYIRDGEVAKITRTALSISTLERQAIPFATVDFEWDMEQARKGEFPHFMLKEIFEGPEVVRSAFRGRVNSVARTVKLGGLEQVAGALGRIQRLIIVACGTSYYAGLVGEYLFEEIAQIPVEVQLASEFRYREEPFAAHTAVIAISQSGETADTRAAVQKAKEHGLLTLGIVNVVGSTIARETDAGVYNHAGPEIGVASTKAFLAQLTTLVMMAAYLAKNKALAQDVLAELAHIPEKIGTILADTAGLEAMAEKYSAHHDFLFLGRRYNYPVALEGALKLKEISYMHAEGYSAGEMKHGPLAMIGEDFPTMAVIPTNDISDKTYSNLQEIQARGGHICAIATHGDMDIGALADDVYFIPKTIEQLQPLLTVVPLHLFAYYVGTRRGFDVDRPRNLAKSVTVE